MLTLDLHGLQETEASIEISLMLLTFIESEHFSLEIITGQGDVLRRVAEEVLDGENWQYYVDPNNPGAYIVEK